MTKNFVHHGPYLRNHASCDCHLWYLCKMVISPGGFFIFIKFGFFGLLGRKKGKKWPKMKSNTYIRYTPDLRNCIAYDHDFWHTCVKWWYLQTFVSVFKILIFQAVMGVKVQKMVQNDQKFCLSCSISQELYIIWLSFMVHMCKIIISPGAFFIFSKFWFFGFLGRVKVIFRQYKLIRKIEHNVK